MAERERADVGTREQDTGKALKRRGILAAAAAAVAGFTAKQASQPVAAANPVLLDTDNASAANTNIHGPGGHRDFGFPTAFDVVFSAENSATVGVPTGIAGHGTEFGVAGAGVVGVYGESVIDTGSGVYGESFGGGYGVTGHGSTGVRGLATTQDGVYGTTDATTRNGVYGHHTGSGQGVLGESVAGFGVEGVIPGSLPGGVTNRSANTVAVVGDNRASGSGGIGVVGMCDGAAGGSGIGVKGASATGIGVFGASNGSGQVAGVYGVSNSAYGVIGNSTAPGFSGLTAITGTAGVAALAATSTVANAFAAFFTGTTVVQGDLAVTGSKSAAVLHPDGSHRLMYCMEAPEAWFEDFGEGTLVGGKATVALDPDFAALCAAGSYHVFPVSHDGGGKGLAVTVRGKDGFTVQEHGGGTGNGTFSYRIVAKRKDNPGKRLEKFALPRINHPNPDTLLMPEPPKKQ